MDWNNIYDIALGFIGGIGGSAAIFKLLANKITERWLEKYKSDLEKERAAYQNELNKELEEYKKSINGELEELKAKLNTTNHISQARFDVEFEFYRKVTKMCSAELQDFTALIAEFSVSVKSYSVDANEIQQLLNKEKESFDQAHDLLMECKAFIPDNIFNQVQDFILNQSKAVNRFVHYYNDKQWEKIDDNVITDSTDQYYTITKLIKERLDSVIIIR